MEVSLSWIFLLATLCHSVNAFDFFDLFNGGGGRGRGSQNDGGHEAGGRCPHYLCDFKVGPCVQEPKDCPCREPQYRCVHGPSHAYSCVASKEACTRLQRKIDE